RTRYDARGREAAVVRRRSVPRRRIALVDGADDGAARSVPHAFVAPRAAARVGRSFDAQALVLVDRERESIGVVPEAAGGRLSGAYPRGVHRAVGCAAVG